jgi:hypothetical protein
VVCAQLRFVPTTGYRLQSLRDIEASALTPIGGRNQPSAGMPAVNTMRADSAIRVNPAFTNFFLF